MANKKKSDKNVAGMTVLNDIRSLLSSSRDLKKSPPTEENTKVILPVENTDALKDRKRYQEQIKQQQQLIAQLETEKKELSETLASLRSSTVGPPEVNGRIEADIAGMEARKEELSLALSQIEDLLQLKLKDLVRRISRVYQEAGDFEAGRDFRRISNQLEAAENFGEFIRTLLRD
jgi:hypothetical protein